MPKVIIVGAGLAGLAAADELGRRGLETLVLEASERLGGRAYGERWEAADRDIDLGGTWLLPTFSEALRLCEEFGIELWRSPESERWLTHFTDGIRAEARLAPEEESRLPQIAAAIEAVRAEHPAGLSMRDALDSVEMPQRLRDWHAATQRYLSGALLDEVDAGHLLIEQTDLVNPEHYAIQLVGTTRVLVEALAARAEASGRVRIRTGSPVDTVTRAGSGWRVRTREGSAPAADFTADAVILAAGRNTLATIVLEPRPGGALADLIERPHAGASRKDWFVLDGVDAHFRVFASTGPFGYFRSEAALPDGGMLAVGLAPQAEGLPTRAEFETAIGEYLPGATIRAHRRHDWVADEWALGTWLGPLPGDYERIEQAASPDPALQVVGGDFATDFPGTLEGAIRTGLAAAERVAGASR